MNTPLNRDQFKKTSLLFENMINQLDEMIVIVDKKANFVVFNNAFKIHTGFYDEPDFNAFLETVGKDQYLEMMNALSKTLESQVKQRIESIEFMSVNKQLYYFSLVFHPFNYSNESQALIVATDHTKERNLSFVKDLVIEMNHMLISTHTLKEYFEYVLKRLMERIQYAHLGTVLIVGEDRTFTIAASRGYDDNFVRNFKLPVGDSFFCRLNPKMEKTPIIINDIDQFDMDGFTQLLDNEKQLRIYSSLSCPIFLNDQLHGLINFDSSKNHVYTSTDVEVMSFLMDQMSFVVNAFYHQEQTRYLSMNDQLTGLYNRWYLDQITNKVIPNCLRHNLFFSLMVLDLNNLKQVNDEFGHDIGDAFLVEAANLFKKRVRESDIVIRIGGDEFVIVFYNAIIENCEGTLTEISASLDKEMCKYEVPLGVCGLAFGGAAFPSDGRDLHSLMRLADERMYRHKRELKGKDTKG